MPGVEEVLAGAKKVLGEAEQKFPSPQMPQPAPSYTQAREARKPESGLAADLKAKADMVGKARKALE